jgi:hypothetical protein
MTTTSDHTPFTTLADVLLETVRTALPSMRSTSDADAMRPFAPAKWSRKQILGHLIDSAANNHQRFVRVQEQPSLVFPGYAQNHWVSFQRYHDRPWSDLVTLWDSYNRHLAHVIAGIPEDRRDTPCVIGNSEPVTLGFLAHDYAVHLRHHLDQMVAGDTTAAR